MIAAQIASHAVKFQNGNPALHKRGGGSETAGGRADVSMILLQGHANEFRFVVANRYRDFHEVEPLWWRMDGSTQSIMASET